MTVALIVIGVLLALLIIYGMPILDVDKAGQVIVLKRSMNTGFAGVDNPLFYNENTALLFGDAKASVGEVLAAVKEL